MPNLSKQIAAEISDDETDSKNSGSHTPKSDNSRLSATGRTAMQSIRVEAE